MKIAHFAIEIGAEKVSLLPYHNYGSSKYPKLGWTYPMEGPPVNNISRIMDAGCRPCRAQSVLNCTEFPNGANPERQPPSPTEFRSLTGFGILCLYQPPLDGVGVGVSLRVGGACVFPVLMVGVNVGR
jgi:hypothetical protein